jgi:hypothetical protein
MGAEVVDVDSTLPHSSDAMQKVANGFVWKPCVLEVADVIILLNPGSEDSLKESLVVVPLTDYVQ